MSHIDVIRAWKDPEYRLGLSEAERALLPEHPAGLIELEDGELGTIEGGFLGGLFGDLFGYKSCSTCHVCAPPPPPPPPPKDPFPSSLRGCWF